MPKWSVPCWNCDEGFVEAIDEWDDDDHCCDICRGEGFLIVTELTDANCEEAVPIVDTGDELDALKANRR